MICCYCHPKEASCQKREKVTEAFLRLALPPLKVDAADDDDDADDGRVGILKAPLPGGTAELKTHECTQPKHDLIAQVSQFYCLVQRHLS